MKRYEHCLYDFDQPNVPLQSYATTLTFMMAMALHPETQRRAQEEIDRVIGSERLPTINDRAHLPYVNAVIKETMRWRPAVPMGTYGSMCSNLGNIDLGFPLLGLARVVAQDDIYEGHFIPKGTIVLPNCWFVDGKVFDVTSALTRITRAVAHEHRGPYEPSEFAPERWLVGGEGDDAPVDPAQWAFGFARRCAFMSFGRHCV